ncbi:MAG: enoyl-CoA hydratase-related protein [Acidimicrobiales bacterium]
MTAEAPIRIDRTDDIVTITLANERQRNVLSAVAMQALLDAFREIAASDATGVIVQAEGPVFSAGHNFGDMVDVEFADAKALFDLCTEMMTTVQTMPQVVIAQVEGIATAAGCQLVATCDLAVAGESATFAAPGGKGGLFCHTPMVAISRAVGTKHGLELALTGDPIDAATAHSWGMINRVVPDVSVAEATRDLLRRATRGSRRSKALGKATYYAQVQLPQDEAYRYATAVMAAGVTTPEAQEGIASFLEKRRPSFPA